MEFVMDEHDRQEMIKELRKYFSSEGMVILERLSDDMVRILFDILGGRV